MFSGTRASVLSLTQLCWYIRAISRNTDLYSNPDVFSPERFVTNGGSPAEMDPRKFMFGQGKRLVLGFIL